MKWITLFLITLTIFACSHINRESREYQLQGKVMRHGIVPQDGKTSNALNAPLNRKLVDRGRKLYENNCFECHGPDALGNGPLAYRQKLPPVNLQESVKAVPHFKLYVSVSHWNKKMPGWKRAFTDKELEELSQYLRSLVE